MTSPVITMQHVIAKSANKAGYARLLLNPIRKIGSFVSGGFSRVRSLPGMHTLVAGFSRVSGLLRRIASVTWRALKSPVMLWSIADNLTTTSGRSNLAKLATPLVWLAKFAGRLVHKIVRTPLSWVGQARLVDVPVSKVVSGVKRAASWLRAKAAPITNANGLTMKIASVVTSVGVFIAFWKTPIVASGLLGTLARVAKPVGIIATAVGVIASLVRLSGKGTKVSNWLQAQVDRLDGRSTKSEVTGEIAVLEAEVVVKAEQVKAAEQAHAESPSQETARRLAKARNLADELNPRLAKKRAIRAELDLVGEMGDLLYALNVREKTSAVTIMVEVMSGNVARSICTKWGQPTTRQGNLTIVENEVYKAQLEAYLATSGGVSPLA